MIKPILLAETLAASSVQAGVNSIDTCQTVGETASKVFEARHLNIPADEMFTAVRNSKTATEIVIDAYTQPRWFEQERIKEKRIEFKSKWFLWCMSTDEVIK